MNFVITVNNKIAAVDMLRNRPTILQATWPLQEYIERTSIINYYRWVETSQMQYNWRSITTGIQWNVYISSFVQIITRLLYIYIIIFITVTSRTAFFERVIVTSFGMPGTGLTKNKKQEVSDNFCLLHCNEPSI